MEEKGKEDKNYEKNDQQAKQTKMSRRQRYCTQ